MVLIFYFIFLNVIVARPDFIGLKTPIMNWDISPAFNQLTPQEKNYTYYMTKATWAGAKTIFHDIAYEAPPMFLIFQGYFQGKNFEALEKSAKF